MFVLILLSETVDCRMILTILFSTFILFSFSACYPQIPPCDDIPCGVVTTPVPTGCRCPLVPKTTTSKTVDICKREVSTPTFKYPHPGTWYKLEGDGKYYYLLGNTVYIRRPDGYYTNWVTSGPGSKWTLNDDYIWIWDENGRWYSHKKADDCGQTKIPLNCIGAQCPRQIRFPSNGIWYSMGGRFIFQEEKGGSRYEQQDNGFYRKTAVQGSQSNDNSWSWNFSTGKWYQTEYGSKPPKTSVLPPKQVEDKEVPYDLKPRI